MAKETSLSAGAIIRDILLNDESVRNITDKVFPIVIDEAKLPYILYRRSALRHDPTKAGHPGADTVELEVVCYTARYAESIELAEAVRNALDYARTDKMRSCVLSGSEEGFEDDAFAQRLVFSIKI